MKRIGFLIVGLVLVLFIGCTKSVNPFGEKEGVYGFSFVEATVVEVLNDKIIVELEGKDIIVGDSYENKLTNKVIKNSLFIFKELGYFAFFYYYFCVFLLLFAENYCLKLSKRKVIFSIDWLVN